MTPQGLVADIADLVTLPEIALRVARLADDPAASAAEIGREISKDSAITTRILRVANSASFGHAGRIDTVTRAVAVLGMRQVRDLAVGLSAVRSFERMGNDLITMESFWRQNVLCAIAAGHIAAGHRAARSAESVFIAGLLHDIGQLVIFMRAPEIARRALLMSIDSPTGQELHLCERELMGFDHGEVGGALARQWGLPRSLQECIEFHHEPEQATDHLIDVAIVHVANSVAVLAEIGSLELEDAPKMQPTALRRIGLTLQEVPALIESTDLAAPELLSLFGADTAPLPSPVLERVM